MIRRQRRDAEGIETGNQKQIRKLVNSPCGETGRGGRAAVYHCPSRSNGANSAESKDISKRVAVDNLKSIQLAYVEYNKRR